MAYPSGHKRIRFLSIATGHQELGEQSVGDYYARQGVEGVSNSATFDAERFGNVQFNRPSHAHSNEMSSSQLPILWGDYQRVNGALD